MANPKTQRAEALNRIEEAAQTGATELSLGDMGLTELLPEIGNLTNLTSLYLRGNQLTALPPEIGNLTNLTSLELYKNQLTALPPEIVNLTNLTSLVLSHNQFRALPPEIGNLTNLTSLELFVNQLSALPPEIGNLTNLTSLGLGYNQLTALPPEIGNLTNLKSLSLHENWFTDLPPEIGNLTNLTSLYLMNNQLTALPPEIVNLTNLTSLELGYNQLTALPPEIVKLGLKFIWKNITSFTKGINLYDNPLESPPVEIVQRGRKAVENYFESIRERDAATKLYEAKLLVVGQGDVGKTWLLNRLITGKTPQTTTTKGIEIHKWLIETPRAKDFRVNFWDFGGQAIYHATHQFFLTKRSLYLFVWEARKEEEILSFDYWLNVISILSDNAPVIVAMNKCDERTKEIDEKTIREKFPNVKGFFKVSALRDDGMVDLKRNIVEEIDRLPHLGEVLPMVWIKIRNKLEGLLENYITFERYLEICKEHELNEAKAKHLARYFHDLGVFLNFDTPPILQNIVFLKPDWATGAVYKLLDTRTIIDALGFFRHEQLRDIWEKYPSDMHVYLLELMKKFELVFELPNNGGYIVPELLAPGLPENVSWYERENLRFEYRYAFMPAGIITRFIVRTHSMHNDKKYWKNGVILEWDDTQAQVICEPLDRRIVISIRGRDKKGLLAIIRKEIQGIHEALNNPEVNEILSCICGKCQTMIEPHEFDYRTLIEALDNNQYDLQCIKSYKMVSILGLLGEYVQSHEVAEIIQAAENHTHYHYHKEDRSMGDTYINEGQTGAMGRKAKAEGNTLQQIQINGQNVDTKTLIEELNKLRNVLSKQASTDKEYEDINKIGEAKKAAEAGDGSKVVSILKSLGTWTSEAITDISTQVIASLISHEMGC